MIEISSRCRKKIVEIPDNFEVKRTTLLPENQGNLFSFLDYTKCNHGDIDEEDDWNSTCDEDDGDAQGRDDEVDVVIQTTSEAGVSAKSILNLLERNEDNTGLYRLVVP